MLRSLLSAATGMDAQQLKIDVIANNLANVNTTAFKQSRAHFHDLLYQTFRAPGQSSTLGTVVPSGIQVGAGTRVSSVEKMFRKGGIQITEKPTDLMIDGEGFFRIQKEDGQVVYTRDGSFKIDNGGRLVTADGFPIVPEVVVPPGVTKDKLNIGMDGIVSVVVEGRKQEIGQVLLANFINPAGLESIGRNLYRVTDASGDAVESPPSQNGMGPIGQGQLENSNVDIVQEMVDMIAGQRAYEINSKVIQTGDQMLQQTNNIR